MSPAISRSLLGAGALLAGSLVACEWIFPSSIAYDDDAGSAHTTDAGGVDDRSSMEDRSVVAEGGGDGARPTCVPGSPSLLTDPHNCGSCGNTCCGATCVNGACTGQNPSTLASGADNPTALALDTAGGALYWAQRSGSSTVIVRYDLATSQKTPLIPPVQPVVSMRVGPDGLYMVNGGWTGGQVAVMAKDGSSFALLAQGQLQPSDVLVAGGQLWWAEKGQDTDSGALHVASLDGGNAQVVYSGQAGPTQLAFAGGTVVWTQFDYGHDVVVGGIDGGGPTTLPANQPYFVVSDGNTAFWTDVSSGSVSSYPPGGPAGVIDSTLGVEATGIAVDAKYVYWASFDHNGVGTLTATPRDGSAHMQLAQNFPCPMNVAVDDKCIYWLNLGTCTSWWSGAATSTGSIMRLDKPQ